MKFFKRRKKQEQVDEFSVMQLEDEEERIKSQGSQMIDYCEQMIETAKNLEDVKAEYKVVTSYLNDIQLLEEMPAEELAEIKEAAYNVVSLGNTRTEYLKTEKKLTDAQFLQMEKNEENIPDAIKRLTSNEAYQAAVGRDMHYLENEKTKWMYNASSLREEQNFLRKMSMVLFGVAVVIFAVLLVMQVILGINTQLIWMLVLFAAGVGGFFIYLRLQSNAEEIKKSDVNRNYTITILNKMKLKYVNATNAVDYACEKWHVKNAYELNYIWEQYMEAAKERDKFVQLNEDIDYFNAKLIQALRRIRLYDARVWLNQANALLDNRELVEVKHNLIERRQKLRSRIEQETSALKEQRGKTEQLLMNEPKNGAEIREILNSIDKLSGI